MFSPVVCIAMQLLLDTQKIKALKDNYIPSDALAKAMSDCYEVSEALFVKPTHFLLEIQAKGQFYTRLMRWMNLALSSTGI